MLTENDPKETNGKPQPATNNPDEAIDTPEKVEESNDEKIDQDFPGYPHYPAKDDILNPGNDSQRVDLDVENLTRSHTITPEHIKSIEGTHDIQPDFTQVNEDDGEDIGMVYGTEADVTAEDLFILGAKDEAMNMEEDEELKVKGWRPITGIDLDMPDLDDAGNEAIGEEDEENSYYSLGGDELEKLQENNDPNNF